MPAGIMHENNQVSAEPPRHRPGTVRHPRAIGPTLRLIERPDVASFRECLDTVAREKRYLAMFQAPPHEAVEAFVRRVTDSSSVQWVAVDGTRVVGWADILRHGADAVTHCGRLGMGVLPAYRQQGLGRRLLRAAIASAHARGITRIELDVRSDRTSTTSTTSIRLNLWTTRSLA